MRNSVEGEHRFTNAQVLVHAQKPTMHEVLRCSRLRYHGRLLGRASRQQLRLVFSVAIVQSTWLQLISEDAEIVIKANKTAVSMWPLPSSNFPEFIRCVLNEPQRWKSAVEKYRKLAAGCHFLKQDEDVVADVQFEFQCPHCPKVSPTKNGIHSHMLSKHDV